MRKSYRGFMIQLPVTKEARHAQSITQLAQHIYNATHVRNVRYGAFMTLLLNGDAQAMLAHDQAMAKYRGKHG